MPVLDVRSPGEYAHGHAPGALSMPLFSDDERAQVGICYKEKGQAEAIRLGLSLVGPKMTDLVAQADLHAAKGPLEVYCWRGGMRSQSVTWLLQTAGHAVKRWEGGYKAYRGRVLEIWCSDHPWVVLCGLTGSGKTEILRHMAAHAEVLDLEGLANHKGSAFGHVGEDEQPTNEQFENDGAQCIQALDPSLPWWIEDESRSIGRIWLQHGFFDRKKEAPLIIAQRSRENRLDHLVALYGQASREDLAAVFPKIAKRLGHQNAQWAVDAVLAGDLGSAADLALQYYDRTYSESMAKRQDYILAEVDVTDCTFAEAAEKILRETSTPLQTWIQQRAQL